MSCAVTLSRTRIPWAVAAGLRWTARVVGALLLGMFVLFAIGEGLPPLTRDNAVLSLMFIAELVWLLGFVALWLWELPGGFIALAGIVAFYGLNYADSGRFPGGWVFPLFFVPGVCAILSSAILGFCRRPKTESTS